MSNVMRIQLKLLSNLCNKYNKNSNLCLMRLTIDCLHYKNSINSNTNPIQMRSISGTTKLNTSPKFDRNKALSERQKSSESDLTIGQKVKQTSEDISYLGVIIVGVSVTALIALAVCRELFSSGSPNVIYSNALKRCKSDPRVIEMIGQPMKGFGEMTSRGRRRHVSSLEYEKDGQQVVRVKFYLKGPKASATVHLEALKKRSKSDFRYLFVESDHNRNVIVLEDNRHIS